MRRITFTLAAALAVSFVAAPAAGQQERGGPVVLMGIDAEDCGPDGHGPITVYEDVLTDILNNVNKPGQGVLVIGGRSIAPEADNCIREFWNQISADLGIDVTFVGGARAIRNVNFSPFLVIAVSTDISEADDPDEETGFLTAAEHRALADRQADVARFVNSGGGVLGFLSNFDPSEGPGPYAYIAGVAPITARILLDYDDIRPTAAGQAIGITDALDVDAWHVTFLEFPSFLNVLAFHDEEGEEGFGEPSVIGGARVVVVPGGRCPGLADLGGNHIVGTPGPDDIVGTNRRDVICALGGHDVVNARDGNDVVVGGPGRDIIRGRAGNDVASGAGGDDRFFGHQGDDRFSGGRGEESAFGGAGDDGLVGGDGVDELWGEGGSDSLAGGPGPDHLNGGPGADDCAGGPGFDIEESC